MTASSPAPALPRDYTEPFSCWAGPRQPRMLLVGEAWGSSEDAHRAPFVGHSGKELIRMLGDAGIGGASAGFATLKRSLFAGDDYFLALREQWLCEAGIALTNVFNTRPQDNKLEALCDPAGKGLVHAGRALAPLVRSPKHQYLGERWVGHLARLGHEVREAKPSVVVALGAAAFWGCRAVAPALASTDSHADLRGTVLPGPPRTLPTYHPSHILRQWSNRPVGVADLLKAWRESSATSFARPARQVLINPELEDLAAWSEALLASPPPVLSCDIETKAGQITSIGFAASRTEALVVPFVTLGDGVFRSYWQTASDERQARSIARTMLRSSIPKLFQNGMYDLQWLLRDGYAVRAVAEDTMLQHFAIHPEMRKGLGFLGSLYTSEPAWKIMRERGKDVVEKKDE